MIANKVYVGAKKKKSSTLIHAHLHMFNPSSKEELQSSLDIDRWILQNGG